MSISLLLWSITYVLFCVFQNNYLPRNSYLRSRESDTRRCPHDGDHVSDDFLDAGTGDLLDRDRGSDFVQDGVTSLDNVRQLRGGGTKFEEGNSGGSDAREAMKGQRQRDSAQKPGEEGRRREQRGLHGGERRAKRRPEEEGRCIRV